MGREEATSSDIKPIDREWFFASVRCDYHEIDRLLHINSGFATRKDALMGYTALHWAARRGNADLVKLLAGSYRCDVNARTNSGHTPLHLAAIARHENIIELLTKTYGADASVRDYSGRQARHYMRQAPHSQLTQRSERATKPSCSAAVHV